MRQGDVVVDVGCADGVMFERWAGLIAYGYGVDPILEGTREQPGYALYPGFFPEALPPIKCDVITMLAVLEHVPPDRQTDLPPACHQILNPGGRIAITVPSPRVDDILRMLIPLRLVDGMSVHEHYGFDAENTVQIFAGPLFRLIHRRTFQMGLNNLFVFERTGAR